MTGVGMGGDWKDWQNVRADLETDSTVAPEQYRCPACKAEYRAQDVQASFDYTFEGLDEYPQHWRRSWVRCRACRHQYLSRGQLAGTGDKLANR